MHRDEIFEVVKAWASQILGCCGADILFVRKLVSTGEPPENDGKMGISPHNCLTLLHENLDM